SPAPCARNRRTFGFWSQKAPSAGSIPIPSKLPCTLPISVPHLRAKNRKTATPRGSLDANLNIDSRPANSRSPPPLDGRQLSRLPRGPLHRLSARVDMHG